MDHLASPPSEAASRRDRNRQALQRIADTLGCPVSALLSEGRPMSFPDQTAELVRLWFSLNNPKKRQAVLDAVRKAAAE